MRRVRRSHRQPARLQRTPPLRWTPPSLRPRVRSRTSPRRLRLVERLRAPAPRPRRRRQLLARSSPEPSLREPSRRRLRPPVAGRALRPAPPAAARAPASMLPLPQRFRLRPPSAARRRRSVPARRSPPWIPVQRAPALQVAAPRSSSACSAGGSAAAACFAGASAVGSAGAAALGALCRRKCRVVRGGRCGGFDLRFGLGRRRWLRPRRSRVHRRPLRSPGGAYAASHSSLRVAE